MNVRTGLLAATMCAALALAGCSSRPRTSPTAMSSASASSASGASALRNSELAADAPPAAMAVMSEPWQFANAQGRLITTPNYRLYTTVGSAEFLQRLPIFYERALEHYTTSIASLPRPSVPLETYLFQTRSQWQTKTQELLPDQAAMFSNLGRGGFTTRGTSVLYYIDRWGYPRDTYAIAAHEGWHQYTQQTFKNQLPIWLEEGVATYMEGYRRGPENMPEFDPARNFERFATLREAVRRDELIGMNDLLTRTPQSFLGDSKESLLVYYAQVWALTRFLAEGEEGRYRPALASVLQDAAHGRLIDRMMNAASLVRESAGRRRTGVSTSRVGRAVAQEYFTSDLQEFERQYLQYVHRITDRR